MARPRLLAPLMLPLLVAAALTGSRPSTAGNPLVPNSGLADPHLHFFNGSFFLFASHDFSPNNTFFRMDDWWIWQSDDLVTWKTASVVKPNGTFPWSSPGDWHECWARTPFPCNT